MKDANYAPVYCALYPKLAEIAREHGYALSIHGSLGRDMDLVCVPWIPTPSAPQIVVDAITSKFAIKQINGWDVRDHGREVTTVSIAFGECFIDLSFMPRVNAPIVPADENVKGLLDEALSLVEYATYHDGRYGQVEKLDWQSSAQKLVRRMAEALGRKPYEGFGG